MARYNRKATMGTTVLGGGVMSLTLALGGCDCHNPGRGGSFAAPIATAGVSDAATVVVSIRPSLSRSVVGVDSPIGALRISGTTTVDLDQVTVHMIHGTNLRGPMVTVPRADLVGQFGNIRILGGS